MMKDFKFDSIADLIISLIEEYQKARGSLPTHIRMGSMIMRLCDLDRPGGDLLMTPYTMLKIIQDGQNLYSLELLTTRRCLLGKIHIVYSNGETDIRSIGSQVRGMLKGSDGQFHRPIKYYLELDPNTEISVEIIHNFNTWMKQEVLPVIGKS